MQIRHIAFVVTALIILHGGCEALDACSSRMVKRDRPYSNSDEHFVTHKYLSRFPNSTVVHAQRGDCKKYAECPAVRGMAFGMCSIFRLEMEAADQKEGPHGRVVIFDDCHGDTCQIVHTRNESRYLVKIFAGGDIEAKANGTCVPEAARAMRTPSLIPFLRETNGTHCMLAVPKGSFMQTQVVCDEENEPIAIMTYKFGRSLYSGKYGCAFVGICKTIMDVLDVVCIAGQDASNVLSEALGQASTLADPSQTDAVSVIDHQMPSHSGAQYYPSFYLVYLTCAGVILTTLHNSLLGLT